VSVFDIAASAGLLDGLTAVSVSAAAAILAMHGDVAVRTKADGSPVTTADEAAEAVIHEGLERLAPALPIISEERVARTKTKPSIDGLPYFLVDPLDGTREFIAGREEYTINIAVIAEGTPILGVIAAPALGLIWRGIVGRGAERVTFASRRTTTPQPIRTRARPEGELVVMVSRSHLDPATQAYVDNLPHTRRVMCGSSLKFCRLAEGAADHYPRLGPTHDWDVAAGHAVLVAAGGSVIDPDGAALAYGTRQLLIPSFLAWGGPAPTEGALKSGY
jgi:3'(2'), 5'-bisphosphate nucleotidase